MEYPVLQFSSDTLFPFLPLSFFFSPFFLFALHSGFPTDITSLNYVAKDERLDFRVFREAFCLQQYLCLDPVSCLFESN